MRVWKDEVGQDTIFSARASGMKAAITDLLKRIGHGHIEQHVWGPEDGKRGELLNCEWSSRCFSKLASFGRRAWRTEEETLRGEQARQLVQHGGQMIQIPMGALEVSIPGGEAPCKPRRGYM